MPRPGDEIDVKACFRALLHDARGDISADTHWGRVQLAMYEAAAKRGTADLPYSAVRKYIGDGVRLGEIRDLLCYIRKQAIRAGASPSMPIPQLTPPIERAAPPLSPAIVVTPSPSPPPAEPPAVSPFSSPSIVVTLFPPARLVSPPLPQGQMHDAMETLATAAGEMARIANRATPDGRLMCRMCTAIALNPYTPVTLNTCEQLLALEPGTILFDAHSVLCALAQIAWPGAPPPRWPGPLPEPEGAEYVGLMERHLADTLAARGTPGVRLFLKNNRPRLRDAAAGIGALADWTPLLQAWAVYRASRDSSLADLLLALIISARVTPTELFRSYTPGHSTHSALWQIAAAESAWERMRAVWTDAPGLDAQRVDLLVALGAARTRFLAERALVYSKLSSRSSSAGAASAAVAFGPSRGGGS